MLIIIIINLPNSQTVKIKFLENLFQNKSVVFERNCKKSTFKCYSILLNNSLRNDKWGVTYPKLF